MALPLGLVSTPQVFTEVLIPILARLWQRGFVIVGCLDDILLRASSSSELVEPCLSRVRLSKSLAGFCFFQKSVLIPSQGLEFLGLVLDSAGAGVSFS